MSNVVSKKKQAVNQTSPDEIYASLQRYSRDPFKGILATALQCQPTTKEMQAFATKSPDRWAQLVAIFARLSGFTDQLDVQVNVMQTLDTMSDAELNQLIEQKLRLFADVEANTMDVEGTPVP